MKHLYKVTMLAALGLGSIVTAQAQTAVTYTGTPQSGGGATYNSGDLILGFTSTSGSDVEYDLGSASSLVSGDTWNLSSILGSYNLSTVNWGVVGTLTTGHLSYLTYDDQAYGSLAPVPTQGAWNAINTAVKTINNNSFSQSGVGNAATIAASSSASWNSETINPTLGTQYQNENVNPNSAGEVAADFWQQTDNGNTPTLLGDFSLGANGVVSFNAVPEPGAYGLLAGAGLLIITLRRPFGAKKA